MDIYPLPGTQCATMWGSECFHFLPHPTLTKVAFYQAFWSSSDYPSAKLKDCHLFTYYGAKLSLSGTLRMDRPSGNVFSAKSSAVSFIFLGIQGMQLMCWLISNMADLPQQGWMDRIGSYWVVQMTILVKSRSLAGGEMSLTRTISKSDWIPLWRLM